MDNDHNRLVAQKIESRERERQSYVVAFGDGCLYDPGMYVRTTVDAPLQST